MKLYEIADNYKNLLELLDSGEVDKNLVEEALSLVEEDIKDKVNSICKIIKENELLVSNIDEEIKRLQQLKKTKNNNISLLKDYLSSELQRMNIKKIDSGIFKVSFRKSTSVNILDEDMIPEEYISETIVKKISKADILKELKQGVKIEGATLEEKQNIQLK